MWVKSVQEVIKDQRYWGYFLPLKGCMPEPGKYVCGPEPYQNLYNQDNWDEKQAPPPDPLCGGVCTEYVFDHTNASLREWLLGEYYFGETGAGNPKIGGFYIDDYWTKGGPTETPFNHKNGDVHTFLNKTNITGDSILVHYHAFLDNQQAWRDKLVNNHKWEWFLFNGGQQCANGWACDGGAEKTCASFLRKNCGEHSTTQNGTLFFGFTRVSHHVGWNDDGSLPHPKEDIAAFLLTRGPYAYIGYGWIGSFSATGSHSKPFTRPEELDIDVGKPQGFCRETAENSGVFTRDWSKVTVQLDCNKFKGAITPKSEM